MLQKGIPWWLSVLINLERACWHQPFYVSPHKKSPVSLKARSRRGCSFCNGFYSNSLCFNNHKGKDRRECQVPSAILGHFCGFRKAWALPIIIFIGFMRDRIFVWMKRCAPRGNSYFVWSLRNNNFSLITLLPA